ncbi:hypothetical protein SARC_17926, partial [Sphaeroforma arctica JP610]
NYPQSIGGAIYNIDALNATNTIHNGNFIKYDNVILSSFTGGAIYNIDALNATNTIHNVNFIKYDN